MRPGGFGEPRLKNSPQDCFCPPGRRRRARAVRIPPRSIPHNFIQNKKAAPKRMLLLVRPGGFEPLAFGVGELCQTGKYDDTAMEIVQCAQLPALVVVVIKECWSVKNNTRNRLGRRSGQMVVTLSGGGTRHFSRWTEACPSGFAMLRAQKEKQRSDFYEVLRSLRRPAAR